MTALASVSIACLAFNMFAIAAFADEVFVQRQTFASIGALILAGFASVLIFNLTCIAWSAYQMNRPVSSSTHPRSSYLREHIAPELMAFGVICTILMAGEKVMVDEIGREVALGWETTGEWIILYTLLSVQLVYTMFTVTRIVR